MAKAKKAGLEAEFKHNTSIGADGTIFYDAPIQIRDQEDLDNYHISWRDCRTLSFHGSERVTVYFMKVESRSYAEYMWATLDTEHSRGYAATRCRAKESCLSGARTRPAAQIARIKRTSSRPSSVGITPAPPFFILSRNRL